MYWPRKRLSETEEVRRGDGLTNKSPYKRRPWESLSPIFLLSPPLGSIWPSTSFRFIAARSIARASEVLDKADPAVVKAVEQGRVTVSCATEIIKLNLDTEDTNELMTLPQPDI